MPPLRIDLDEIVLRRENLADAPVVAEAIASNIPRLAPWMEWAVEDATPVATQESRIADSLAQWDSGSMFDYMIADGSGDEFLGKAGIRLAGPDHATIGYWVTEDAEGRGIVTRVARALTALAAELDGIVRVEIHCDAANDRSRAVPERLGYRLDRVIDHPITTSHQTGRQMIWIYDAS
ncbi:GNAT family N-acetyltransferase [Rhodococcus sp. RS1C4]|uniref:GNAT family N-acetyltransferase n=1 Tax=Rhodococcus sp. 114MFTsu3.1 TaxID=1172184 RepID=UPI00037A0905|nr:MULTISPECIES: GNAT family N-acetyltransferase [unclassified Rhodococcus (in: high G+C Gram-positive bacteria)]OZC54468.1 GNAT family N-acetyltransferase [Rhodococcus sp. RS1C4]OZC75579.1 GNAT family N-acetyltransferase [Rhodococcus sp. 06-418-1B]OZE83022.1 GNAT family N-acetyltransferase [Rhodococcus sp. 15-649-1-2]